MAKVLIIDDEEDICNFLAELIETIGHKAVCVHSRSAGMNCAEQDEFDIVLLDIYLPDGNGLDILPSLRMLPNAPEIIIMTGLGDPDCAELALRNGAWSYIQKPLSPKAIIQPLRYVLEYREQRKVAIPALENLVRDNCIGEAPAFRKCLEQLAASARSHAAILLTGETGTGKEVFAHCLHANSLRAKKPFMVLDCTSIPENLMESILFGHEKGAFTGAQSTQIGLIEAANEGTLFLDELGDLPLTLQKKLLRVLQEKSFCRLGSHEKKHSDFRLIAATNRNLQKMVDENQFRADLLYRIQTIKISLPSLQERKSDIPLLINHILHLLYKSHNIEPKECSQDLIEALIAYDWPGNIRQLHHVLENIVVTAMNATTLFSRHVPEDIRINSLRATFTSEEDIAYEQNIIDIMCKSDIPNPVILADMKCLPTYKKYRIEALKEIDLAYFSCLMKKSGGDFALACSMSGLGRSRLYGMLKQYGITKGNYD